MLGRIFEYFYDRASRSAKPHPIYILPTIDGVKVVSLNVTLLVLGLVYANNYVLLFNFILFCLFLASMFYTHFNLSGLKLDSIHFSPLHASETSVLNLHFSSTNAQGHYFIRPRIKSPVLEIIDPTQTYPINFGPNSLIQIPIKGIKRGQSTLNSIYIETLFPFNFFRCFTFFQVNTEHYVYPERVNLKQHKEVELTEEVKDQGDDFFIRDYQIGDSLKRIDWKKLAQTNRWYTREFQAANPNPVLLSLNEGPLEESLKSLCFSLHNFHHRNIKYGLKLNNRVYLSPENSPHHLSQCLRELARYEN